MNYISFPDQCLLCRSRRCIVKLSFQQIYHQNGGNPQSVNWWGCQDCKGWFAHPVPGPSHIEEFCEVVEYNNPRRVIDIAKAKEPLQRRVLAGLSRWVEPGPLLDFGCNYGHFMIMARNVGWQPSGFEPYASAAEAARAKGFDVRSKWSIDEAGFTDCSFSAITAIDVFGLVWKPIDTLETLHRLLKPGGVLGMRLTNKQFVLGITQAITPRGQKRNKTISNILGGQFHSISLGAFMRIIERVGFSQVTTEPGASAAPMEDLSWKTRIAYVGSGFMYHLSMSKINLSPGVLLFARK